MNEWQPIGRIVRLQVQTQSVKQDLPDGTRVYRPADALLQVETLQVDAQGAIVTHNGQTIIDKHHARHPDSHHNGSNPISVGFSTHYERIRRRFGTDIQLGMAAENIIVETARFLEEADLTGELAIRGTDGTLTIINDLYGIPPCRPFTIYCLGDQQPEAADLKAGLQFLTGGMRGFAGMPTNTSPHTLRLGDEVLLRQV